MAPCQLHIVVMFVIIVAMLVTIFVLLVLNTIVVNVMIVTIAGLCVSYFLLGSCLKYNFVFGIVIGI